MGGRQVLGYPGVHKESSMRQWPWGAARRPTPRRTPFVSHPLAATRTRGRNPPEQGRHLSRLLCGGRACGCLAEDDCWHCPSRARRCACRSLTTSSPLPASSSRSLSPSSSPSGADARGALAAGVGTATQAALVVSCSALAFPAGVPLSAALVAAVVVALSLHVLDHLACGGG